MTKRISYIILLAVCLGSILLAVPTISNNIHSPNMVIYFNADEGGLMDLVWSYYSGEKRDSYQWDFDYGLEMVYLADFARLILSPFIDFTPGMFVLILRWIHLITWILALIALWRLIGYHFGKGWQQVLPVLLLATRSSFAYLTNHLKPEPLVLLFMIIGLDYALRIPEYGTRKKTDTLSILKKHRALLLAIACAAAALVIKFAGLFLLPAIIMAVYFNGRYQNSKVFSAIARISWIFPGIIGIITIIFPLAILFFYVRSSTGGTWYEQFGLWGSLMQNRFILLICGIGVVFIFLSGIMWFLKKNNRPSLKAVIIDKVSRINACAFMVCGIFLLFVMLFGIRWIITPQYFIATYAQLGPVFLAAGSTEGGLLSSFLLNVFRKIKEFDLILIFMFIFYAGIEIYLNGRTQKKNELHRNKRFILLILLIPFFILVFVGERLTQYHILPFFAAMSILVTQGIVMFNNNFKMKRLFKNVALSFAGLLFVIDIGMNGIDTVRLRFYQFNQKEDIVFEIAAWLRENISPEAFIVADHHTQVYIPDEYENIRIFKGYQMDRIEQLRRLVNNYKPQFIYYNKYSIGGRKPWPPIEEILPDKKVKLVKSFDSKGRRYQRRKRDKFLIYELLN